MFAKLAKAVTALSLMLSSSLAAPAWSASKSHSSAKCHHAKQKQAMRSVAPQPVRSVMVVEKRKMDVQILSFGP